MEFNSDAIAAAATGFRLLFLAAMADAKPLYVPFCQRIESTGAQETFEIPEGFGEMREWTGELQLKPAVRWSQTITNKDWESSFSVPRNAYLDDNLGVYKSQAQLLGASAATHPDKLLFDTMIGGFTAVGYDNVAFFSANHPRGNGLAAQNNLISGALSASTYRTALAALQSMTDYYGKPLRLGGMGAKIRLIVGPSLRATAMSIVAMQTTSSGAGNPDYGTAEVQVNEYLSGDYANHWFVAYGDGPVRPFILQEREAVQFHVLGSSPNDPEVVLRKRVLHSAQGRWNMGYGFYQLIVGSTGS